MTGPTLLRLTGVFKAYAGVQALRGVSFDLRAGEVHALVGENGAGKSTLVKIITGAVRQDAGEIEVEGEPIGHYSPRAAKELGIAAIYQQPPLFPELTVFQTVLIGRQVRREAGPLAHLLGTRLAQQDERAARPYCAYRGETLPSLRFDNASGDVHARVGIRAAEILQSASLIENAFKRIPAGNHRIRMGMEVSPSPGRALASVEGPRPATARDGPATAGGCAGPG